MMKSKEIAKIISVCYKIPENKVDVGTVHVENITEWIKARKAVDVAIFRAGYDKRESEFVYNPDYLDFQKGVKTGRELGIREVVEYKSESMMEYHDKYCEEDKVVILVIPQAKLKEWSIKEG